MSHEVAYALAPVASSIGAIANEIRKIPEAFGRVANAMIDVAGGLHAIARAISSHSTAETQKEGGA